MDAKTRLNHLVLTLPSPTLLTALREYCEDRQKTLLVKATGNATEGFATVVSVNKTTLMKAKGKTQRDSDAIALRRAWTKLITSSKDIELGDIETYLCKSLASVRKVQGHVRPVSVFEISSNAEPPSPHRPSISPNQYDTQRSSFVSDISADGLLQRVVMAKKLHESLTATSEKKVILTKAVIRKKPAVREEWTSVAKTDRSLIREEHTEHWSTPTAAQRSQAKTYRSLADARYEAKARQSKQTDKYRDGEDSAHLGSR